MCALWRQLVSACEVKDRMLAIPWRRLFLAAFGLNLVVVAVLRQIVVKVRRCLIYSKRRCYVAPEDSQTAGVALTLMQAYGCSSVETSVMSVMQL